MLCVFLDHDECATGNHTCNHICNNLPGTHECLCYTGYKLSDDGYTCVGKYIIKLHGYIIIHSIDINECELGYCTQLCNNSEGSFTCSCQDGYALEDDNRTCVGKFITQH